MSKLGHFYNDEHLREEVKEFLIEHLAEIAVKKAFAGEDVAGIADARKAILSAFSELKALHSPRPEKKIRSSR